MSRKAHVRFLKAGGGNAAHLPSEDREGAETQAMSAC